MLQANSILMSSFLQASLGHLRCNPLIVQAHLQADVSSRLDLLRQKLRQKPKRREMGLRVEGKLPQLKESVSNPRWDQIVRARA